VPPYRKYRWILGSFLPAWMMGYAISTRYTKRIFGEIVGMITIGFIGSFVIGHVFVFIGVSGRLFAPVFTVICWMIIFIRWKQIPAELKSSKW